MRGVFVLGRGGDDPLPPVFTTVPLIALSEPHAPNLTKTYGFVNVCKRGWDGIWCTAREVEMVVSTATSKISSTQIGFLPTPSLLLNAGRPMGAARPWEQNVRARTFSEATKKPLPQQWLKNVCANEVGGQSNGRYSAVGSSWGLAPFLGAWPMNPASEQSVPRAGLAGLRPTG